MKNKSSLRALLGITQQEAAILLRIKRSQLSLYELGLRDIPADAMIRMTKVWLQMEKSEDVPLSSQQRFAEKEQEWQAYLNDEMIKNKSEQIKIRQRLETIEKNYESNRNAFKAAVSWEKCIDDITEREKEFLKIIAERAAIKLAENGWDIQEKYRLELKVLEQYEKLLKERMSSSPVKGEAPVEITDAS